jgi:hypothetical protein
VIRADGCDVEVGEPFGGFGRADPGQRLRALVEGE